MTGGSDSDDAGGVSSDETYNIEDDLPESKMLKELSEALYDKVKAEYVEELSEDAHEVLHRAIDSISVFCQLMKQREKRKASEVRSRKEIKRRKEIAQIRINDFYMRDWRKEREDIIEETLDWVLGERDTL